MVHNIPVRDVHSQDHLSFSIIPFFPIPCTFGRSAAASVVDSEPELCLINKPLFLSGILLQLVKWHFLMASF